MTAAGSRPLFGPTADAAAASRPPGAGPRRVVVVGGVAAGMSFAARARRLNEEAEIVVLERGAYVSFANCGLPYHVGGEIAERGSLVLQTPESLRATLNLDVRVGHEVAGVNASARTVSVRLARGGGEIELGYDALVLATGADAVVPEIPGVRDPAVHLLRTVPDADAIRTAVGDGARRALVLGAGYIGLEAAEALRHRGLDVTVVELADQVLPALDAEMAGAVDEALRRAGVHVRTATSLLALRRAPDSGLYADLSDGTAVPTDLVLIAAGVRPASALGALAGARLGPRGHIQVDEHFATSVPGVYAIGDAIEVHDAVTGTPAAVALAGPAARQGRALAGHLFGPRGGTRAPVLGTAIVRVFDTVAAITGRSEKSLAAAGVEHRVVHAHPTDHAGYYPGAQAMHLKLVFAEDGRVLGAQATGGEGVDKRIDVIATAIRAGMTVHDLAELELAYAPPFGSAKDPVNMIGFIAGNVLEGTTALWYAADLDSVLAETAAGRRILLDVRSRAEFDTGHLPGAVNIPHTRVRDRLAELPADCPISVYCAAGVRSYLALRILRQTGRAHTASLDGGLATLHRARPNLSLAAGVPVPAAA